MREFRMICLTCISTDFVKQIDLCLSCMNTPVIMDQFDHRPHHPLVKVKWLLQDREKPKIIQDALNAVERAKALFPMATTHVELIPVAVTEDTADDSVGMAEGREGAQDSRKLCICCNTLVSVPFWICVSCGESACVINMTVLKTCRSLVDVDTLICTDCDVKKRPPLSPESKHDETHPLVRYQYPETDTLLEVKTIESKLASLEISINDRLDRLETHIANHDIALDQRFERLEQALEKRLGEQEAAFNARLDAMEKLLRAFATGTRT
jgi:hypothetical protein